jgi:hypothetical protein
MKREKIGCENHSGNAPTQSGEDSRVKGGVKHRLVVHRQGGSSKSVVGYVPEFDCMAARKNAICQRFFDKISQIRTAGVNFLGQSLQTGIAYYCCCPPDKMIGRVVCYLLKSKNIQCLLIVPVWPSTAFW